MSGKGILSTFRPANCAISALGVFVGHSIAISSLQFGNDVIIAMASAALITAGGNTINDFFDTETDSRLGRLKFGSQNDKRVALIVSIALFLAGIALATLLPLQALAIAVGVSGLLILYSGAMQEFKFLGNWVVALGTALTFVYGAALTQYYGGVFFLASSAFFANVAREITKDMEDIEGDRGSKNTLPMFVSFSQIRKVLLILYVASLSVALMAYAIGIMHGILYLGMVAVTGFLFANAYRLVLERRFSLSQRMSKYAMLAALIAFVLGI